LDAVKVGNYLCELDRVPIQREAEVLSSQNHSNVATLYGLEESDRKSFTVMELVNGEKRSVRGRLMLKVFTPTVEPNRRDSREVLELYRERTIRTQKHQLCGEAVLHAANFLKSPNILVTVVVE
jgi:hypothetical protein